MKKRVLAMILAISLVLGLSTGLVFAADGETEEKTTITIGGDAVAVTVTDSEDVTIYFDVTTSGYYKIYTSGDYDTYATLYKVVEDDEEDSEDGEDSEDDEDEGYIAYDDDSGSGQNAAIKTYLEAGSYYIVFEPMFYEVAEFTVKAESYSPAVSAKLTMSGSITLIQGIDSEEWTEWEYDEETGTETETASYDYYYFNYEFSNGDTITVTYQDGSAKTYTYSDYDFFDENGDYLGYDVESDQSYENQWQTGKSYTMTMVLFDEDDVEIEVTVSIIENPYVSAKYIPVETLTLVKGVDSYTEYTEYDDDGNGVEGTEYEYYDLRTDDFNDGDQIVIYDKNGNTYTYTYKTSLEYEEDEDYYWLSSGFRDEDGDYLNYDMYTDEDQESDPWEVGETHSFMFKLYGYGLDIEVQVLIADEDSESSKDTEIVISPGGVTVSGSIDKYALAKALVGTVISAEEYELMIEEDYIAAPVLKVSDEGVSKEDTAKVDEYITSSLSGYTKGLVLDITLWFSTWDDGYKQVTNTYGVPQNIEITIPDSLINTDSSIDREYKIIKVHDGAAEEVEATYDSETNTISFVAYEFSTYAIVYMDTDADIAKTGDSNNAALWICILAAAGLGLAGVCLRRKFN